METQEFNTILVFSSFIFITNIISTIYKKYYFYSFIFFLLTLSSILFHYNTNIYTSIIDKIMILVVILYGGHLLYNKSKKNNSMKVLLIVISFLAVIFLYCYGYFVKDYCFHPDKLISDKYHSILHIVSSLGHQLIIFL
jgi:hypothetical protein